MFIILYRYLYYDVYLFENGEYKGIVSHCDFVRYADNRDVWIIYDPPRSTDPTLVQEFNASCVMFSSPEARRYSKFLLNSSSGVYYLPPWDLEELQQLLHYVPFFQDRISNNIEGKESIEKFLQQRFEIFGGQPRDVFRSVVNNTTYNKWLERDIEEIQDIVKGLSGDEVEFLRTMDVNFASENFETLYKYHQLVHMKPKPKKSYRSYDLVYASPLCFLLVGYRNLKWVMLSAGNELQTRLYGEKRGTYPGLLFELCLHQILIYGKRTFNIRLGGSNNVDRSPFNQKFEVNNGVLFSKQNLEDISSIESNVYYFPTIENFATADSFMVLSKATLHEKINSKFGTGSECLVIFQSTVAKEHDLKVDGLMTIVNKVHNEKPNVKDVICLFCVPSERFQKFKVSKVIMSTNDEVNKKYDDITMQRAVMEIDYGTIKNGLTQPETTIDEQNKVQLKKNTDTSDQST
jgi:MoaA/NifB/PqqE/SkfB family radical SAM enzyme